MDHLHGSDRRRLPARLEGHRQLLPGGWDRVRLQLLTIQPFLESSQLLQIQLQPRATSMRQHDSCPCLCFPAPQEVPLSLVRTEMTRLRPHLVFSLVRSAQLIVSPISLQLFADAAWFVVGSDSDGYVNATLFRFWLCLCWMRALPPPSRSFRDPNQSLSQSQT